MAGDATSMCPASGDVKGQRGSVLLGPPMLSSSLTCPSPGKLLCQDGPAGMRDECPSCPIALCPEGGKDGDSIVRDL